MRHVALLTALAAVILDSVRMPATHELAQTGENIAPLLIAGTVVLLGGVGLIVLSAVRRRHHR